MCNSLKLPLVTFTQSLTIGSFSWISVLEVRNKDPDKTTAPFGKIFQCLAGCLVTKVWDIRASEVDKVFNTFKVIVY